MDSSGWTWCLLISIAVIPPARGASFRDLERAKLSSLPPPPGYQRIVCAPGSFGEWLRELPLKSDGNILDHKGRPAGRSFYRVLAVVDLPLMFADDLEQCADFCMRFWADYHSSSKRLDELSLFRYSGEELPFAESKKSYRSFLRTAFANTNSFSLKQGCTAVRAPDLSPGDMFVQNRDGGVGHVSMIVDMCRPVQGEPGYLVGFSFMPAQEFHIERADAGAGPGGWFTLSGYRQFLAANLAFADFGEPVYRRFREHQP